MAKPENETSTTGGNMSDNAREAAKQGKRMADQASETIRETAGKVGTQARELSDDLYTRGQEAAGAVRAQVDERPMVALVAAFGLGLAFGVLFSRGR